MPGWMRTRPVRRRGFLEVGTVAGLGLTLPSLLAFESRARGAESTGDTRTPGRSLEPRAKAVIQLHLGGGFPQHESFDPKPEAPAEYRGSFGVVKTHAGDVFSDNLPKLAAEAGRFTVLRSVVGKIPDHAQATYHLFKAYTPTAVIDYPPMGSVVSHELGRRGLVPPYVVVPNQPLFVGGTGFLGSAYGPFELNSDPGKRGFRVGDISLPDGMSLDRFARGRRLREAIGGHIRSSEADLATLDSMDGFYEQAFSIITSVEAQRAFTLEGEPEGSLSLYGSTITGSVPGPDRMLHPKGLAERLIVARRLVEAGARFVTVSYGEWDAHTDVRKACLDQMAPLDHALAGLITDLDRRGMLDTTLVWVTTEFGRTPKVNAAGGRDHHARCYSMMLAGGGVARGLIHGVSDSTGGEPARDAVTLEDVQHTVYHLLGIDATKELVAFGTRPIEIVQEGRLVSAILA